MAKTNLTNEGRNNQKVTPGYTVCKVSDTKQIDSTDGGLLANLPDDILVTSVTVIHPTTDTTNIDILIDGTVVEDNLGLADTGTTTTALSIHLPTGGELVIKDNSDTLAVEITIVVAYVQLNKRCGEYTAVNDQRAVR